MLSCAQEFIELLESRRSALIECARVARESTEGMSDYTPADLKQMVSGFVTILSDAATETGGDTFTFFIDTVVPGMLASGDNLPTVMHGGIAFSNLLIAEVARHVAPEHYTETVTWLSKFVAHYHVSVLRKGISVGLTPSVRSLQPTST